MPAVRVAVAVALVAFVGVVVLGAVVVLDAWPDNNKFWHQFLGIGAGCAVLAAAASLILPTGGRSPPMSVGIGLLLVLIVGATALGVLVGQDMIGPGGSESATSVLAILVGLVVANAALMTVLATSLPANGSALRRLATAPVAAAASASLISGGFWMGAWVPEQETSIGESGSFGIAAYFFVWVLTAAFMAVAGIAAWGVTRIVVPVAAR